MIDIKTTVEKHSLWLKNIEGGERANFQGVILNGSDLPGVNLSYASLRGNTLCHANLQGANLQEADLREANLKYACLQKANLQHAKLCYANLQGADLQGANLQGADLREADLQNAHLQRADLRWAALSETALYGADLEGADLIRTCLNPSNTPNRDYKGFEEDGDYIIGYRTKRRLMNDGEYTVGEKVTSPYFSISFSPCHPGLYLYPTVQMVLNFMYTHSTSLAGPIIKVKAKKTDIHRAGDKWRCKEFEVLSETEY